MVAAIALWNTVYLERAITALRQQQEIDDSLMSHVAPLCWNHINLAGNYVWHANKRVAKGAIPAVAHVEIERTALAYKEIRLLRPPLVAHQRISRAMRSTPRCCNNATVTPIKGQSPCHRAPAEPLCSSITSIL